MILRTLYDYYNRKNNEQESFLAPEGMEDQAITFLIVLDLYGHFLRLECTENSYGRPNIYRVLKHKNRTSSIDPNAFWDNAEHVLNMKITNGLCVQADDKKAKQNAFIDFCKELHKLFPENKEFYAVCRFYEQPEELLKITNDPVWKQVIANGSGYFSFIINGQQNIVASHPDILKYYKYTAKAKKQEQFVCLITGNKDSAVRLTTATPIKGSKRTASLVSFQLDSGYDSYNKKQCFNAPISPSAEASYTTALNYLLSNDSRNKFVIGNRTFVFWASSSSEAAQKAEQSVFALFGFPTEKDNPDYHIESVRKNFESIYSGIPHDSQDCFYFLGLAPNSARISVIYWNECPLRDFSMQILNHFQDMEIADTRKEKKSYSGLYSILAATTLNGKVSEASPNMPEAIIKSILQNTPYPYALFMACLNRIRARQDISITQAAVIKGYLNRILNTNQKLLSIMLDKENTNIGYLCGRLLSVFVWQQEKCNDSNSIRTRYMNAACSTPAAVFPTIMNLATHHADKLDDKLRIFCEQLASEIIEKIPANGFPAHLDIYDQGRFLVGYYHQRQAFFTKKTMYNEIVSIIKS